MNSKRHKIFSALFLFAFLSAFSGGLYHSLKNSLPELAHFSKHKELKNNSETNQGSENFVYEENETENEIEDGLELQALVLPFFAAFHNVISVVNSKPSSELISTRPSDPIYLSIRNLRI